MRIGVLGTGMVGQALATKLVELGHEVTLIRLRVALGTSDGNVKVVR